MPNIFKRMTQVTAQLYEFPDAAELQVEEESAPLETEEPEEEGGGKPSRPALDPTKPVDYARLQADAIMTDAERQAEELLENARRQAQAEAEEIRAAARTEGRQEGYNQGLSQALEESIRQRERQAAELEEQVRAFLDKASAALDRQMDENLDQLRDLAIAVAEKVVCISLKSSSEVIARMIQAAVDKRKRREWVHIYIAECDAKRMTQVPESLTSMLSLLSDRVRIIPMADDESGTCIIETPDEIIDASAATQMSNIRTLLSDTPIGGQETLFTRRSEDRVPTIGPPGL